MSQIHTCPNCESNTLVPFYDIAQVPVHSVLLLETQDAAFNYPKGDINLALCKTCGFITNTDFDASLHEYSSKYEETQGFSPTFNAFHKQLAEDLIERHDLRHKTIIEIGCGKGEFLSMICELGENKGIGFDPAYIPERNQSDVQRDVTFIKDFYSEKYAHYQGDFFVCKMTLEHIPDTLNFIRMVRNAIGENYDTTVFFQVPDAIRVLDERAFWDIYYEHCSYFSLGSLARLFRKAGFDVTNLRRVYGEQYLIVEAKPARVNTLASPKLSAEDDLSAVFASVDNFSETIQDEWSRWLNILNNAKAKSQKIVIWGAGSKGVAFLTTLNIQEDIEFAVDINPYKHNHYMAGTGQKIVSPEFLKTYQPDIVLVMNPIYTDEIARHLNQLGVLAALMPVGRR